MSAEVSEIIRVLQLTTYDEDEWDSDNLTVMRKNMGIIESKLQTALDWLNDPNALQGGVGEKSIRQILAHAKKVADRSLPNDADHLRKLSGKDYPKIGNCVDRVETRYARYMESL